MIGEGWGEGGREEEGGRDWEGEGREGEGGGGGREGGIIHVAYNEYIYCTSYTISCTFHTEGG